MIGSISEIALAIQSAKGSAAAASSFRFPIVSGMPEVLRRTQRGSEVRSTRMTGDPFVVAAYGVGEVAAIARPRGIGALLYAALGAKAVSGASDPFTHTFTLGSQLPWLTVWRHFAAGLNERFVDSRISKLVIESQHGRAVRVSFEILSGSPRYRTAQETTAALETTQHFEHVHGTGAYLLEGVAIRTIESWTLVIVPNVTIEQTLAGPVARMNGRAEISLQTTYRPADAALWRRAVYGSTSPADDALPASTGLELGGSPVGVRFTLTAASSPERSLRIDIPRVVLDPPPMQPNTRGETVRNTLNLIAFDPTGSTSPLTAVLKNAVAAY